MTSRDHRVACVECERTFDLADPVDCEEWAYGHDCEHSPDHDDDCITLCPGPVGCRVGHGCWCSEIDDDDTWSSALDTWSSASRQHYIDTGEYLPADRED